MVTVDATKTWSAKCAVQWWSAPTTIAAAGWHCQGSTAVLQQATACRGELDGFIAEVIEDHIRERLVQEKDRATASKAADEFRSGQVIKTRKKLKTNLRSAPSVL